MAGSCWLHCRLRIVGSCWFHFRLKLCRMGRGERKVVWRVPAGFTVGLGCVGRRVLAGFTLG